MVEELKLWGRIPLHDWVGGGLEMREEEWGREDGDGMGRHKRSGKSIYIATPYNLPEYIESVVKSVDVDVDLEVIL